MGLSHEDFNLAIWSICSIKIARHLSARKLLLVCCLQPTNLMVSQVLVVFNSSESFITHNSLFENTICDQIEPWLPHTQYQTYGFTRNGLLVQCTITFYWVRCSKAMSLVSVAAFPRPCVSLEWCFEVISWSRPSCIDA